jgi:carbon monoxide dehydrogenase subunit G
MNLTFDLQQPIELVFDYLTNMQKFVSVHPVISKIEPVSGNCYLVHETLKLGPIPVSFTYTVTVESNALNKTVMIKATVMKLTKIDMHYTLTQMAGHTRIEETIDFRSYLPIKFVMQKIFRKQHTQLFENINKLK